MSDESVTSEEQREREDALVQTVLDSFEGTELARVAVADGSIGHAEIRIGDTTVLAFDRRPDWPAMPSLLRVWVPDADAAIEQAIAAGGVVVTAPADSAFGQRGGRVRDPFGNIWWVVTQAEVVAEEEMWRRLSEPRYAEQLRVAQETLDAELSGEGGGWNSAVVR